MPRPKRKPRHKRGGPPNAGRCLFCNGTGLTKQHLFPARLRDLLPARTESTVLSSFKATFIELPGRQQGVTIQPHFRQRAKGNIATWQMRCICRTCNETWIRAIEDKAFPALRAMIRGLPRVISPDEQEAIAAWAGIVVTMNERRFPDSSTVSIADRDHLRTTGTLPETWSIYVGHYSGKGWSWRIQHRPLVALLKADLIRMGPISGRPINAQTSVVVIGNLLIHVASMPAQEFLLSFRGRTGQSLYRFWPNASVGRIWPPGIALTDFDADFISNVYVLATQGLNQGNQLPT